jgi:hypothetical protein
LWNNTSSNIEVSMQIRRGAAPASVAKGKRRADLPRDVSLNQSAAQINSRHED